MPQVQATIAHQGFRLDSEEIERRMQGVDPEPIDEHFVVVGGRRFPPKQVIEVTTGLDRADFNSHQARRLLARLGFGTGRRLRDTIASADATLPHGGAEAEALRPYIGRWVAQRGLEVLVAGESPNEVLGWLRRHGQTADCVFRVPKHESESGGFIDA